MDMDRIAEFESAYGKLTPAYRRRLLDVLAREPQEWRDSGLTLLALKAFPSSPLQRMLQSLKASK